MIYKYKPYIISLEFDKRADFVDKTRWVASATLDLGDANGPRYQDERSQIEKKVDKVLFGKDHAGNQKSLGYTFTFFVCSKEFQNDPTDDYKKYVNIMLVQDEYNPIKASEWLRKKIEEIGEVTESELTKQIHKLLEAEELDFGSKDNP